jgi:hypothetical protein
MQQSRHRSVQQAASYYNEADGRRAGRQGWGFKLFAYNSRLPLSARAKLSAYNSPRNNRPLKPLLVVNTSLTQNSLQRLPNHA